MFHPLTEHNTFRSIINFNGKRGVTRGKLPAASRFNRLQPRNLTLTIQGKQGIRGMVKQILYGYGQGVASKSQFFLERII